MALRRKELDASLYRLGIDVGGTFTDVALLAPDGQLHVHKRPTDSADIALGCVEAIAEAADRADVPLGAIAQWRHGTTVVLNALLERRGARTALLVTEGFRDILEIRRQMRPHRYDLRVPRPEALAPRSMCFEVRERMLPDGSVLVPLDREHLVEQIGRMRELGVEAVAICLLHSYANSAHEAVVSEVVAEELPDAFVTTSHELLNEFREFPRASTTVANSFAGPVLSSYLDRLSVGARERGLAAMLTVFQSNGGVVDAATAARSPVTAIYSGPAAGVAGAVYVADRAGARNIVTLDIGGTSTDVCLVRNGSAFMMREKAIAGFPIRASMTDVHSIGAGGGSIAWINRGGLLEVGPESAGSRPGPAGYGLGGVNATVTDANIVLGRLTDTGLLAGSLRIDRDAAFAAVGRVADALGASVSDTAMSIIEITNQKMASAIRVVSVERGYDYRDCVLVAYGGAGPLHGAELAAALGFTRVLVPPSPGILCALGLLAARYRFDAARTRFAMAERDSFSAIETVLLALQRQARDWAEQQGLPADSLVLQHAAELRYRGQSHELSVAIDGWRDEGAIEEVKSRFHEAHETAYGYADRDSPVEFVNFRLVALGPESELSLLSVATAPDAPIATAEDATAAHGIATVGTRDVWFRDADRPVAASILDRARLPCGTRIDGPAVIEQTDSTTVVIPGWTATVDAQANLVLEPSLAEDRSELERAERRRGEGVGAST